MELIDKAHIEEYDYYAFSDQDDIWLPDKVHVAVQAIQNMMFQQCITAKPIMSQQV